MGWLLRLWVLLLAVLLQIGTGQAQVNGAPVGDYEDLPAAVSGEAEAPEEMGGKSSPVDEAFEPGWLASGLASFHGQVRPGSGHLCRGGLSAGRPASGTPFKPPRC